MDYVSECQVETKPGGRGRGSCAAVLCEVLMSTPCQHCGGSQFSGKATSQGGEFSLQTRTASEQSSGGPQDTKTYPVTLAPSAMQVLCCWAILFKFLFLLLRNNYIHHGKLVREHILIFKFPFLPPSYLHLLLSLFLFYKDLFCLKVAF